MGRSTTKNSSQPRGTQRKRAKEEPGKSQKGGRRVRDEDEDGEEEPEEGEGEGEENVPGEGQNEDRESNLKRKCSALVRLAIFNESRRLPLRREDINKRALGGNTRDFKVVFEMAQKQLRSVFGMELVELMTRAEREKEQNIADHDDENSTGLRKKAATSSSKSYILRSTLNLELIEIAAETQEDILEEEIVGGPDDGDESDDDTLKTYGSLISWSNSDQLGGIGFLYVMLALILITGRSMSDLDLRKHLRSFNMSLASVIELPPTSAIRSQSVEAYLQTLIRQGFLDRVKVGLSGAPAATQGKRGRPSAVNEEGTSFEWRWGSRAHSEVGEQAIAQFVAEFMVERILKATQDEQDDSEEEGVANERIRGKRARDKGDEKDTMLLNMLKGITRAVGGPLYQIR